MGINITCENCNNTEQISGDMSKFIIVSYPESTQVSVECSVCGNIEDLWTWESTMEDSSEID